MAKKKSAKQEAKEIEILERGNRVLELRKTGVSLRAIAAKLAQEGVANVSYVTVKRDIQAALKILAEDRGENAAELRELQTERLELLMMANWTPAMGKVEKVIDKNTGKPLIENGKEVLRTIPASVPHGRLVREIIGDISDLHNLKVQRHEHTGKDGQPIETVNYPSLDDWQKTVEKRRLQAEQTQGLFVDGIGDTEQSD